MLDVNEVKTYTVVGVVESCNFTNEPEAYWSCGNLVNGVVKDGTITNPVSSTASVLFNPVLPNVQVQVSSPITFPYCTVLSRTVTVTVTNSGGPAGNFRLDSGLESDAFLGVIPGSVSAGWQYIAANGVFSYTGGSPTGTLAGGSVLTLTFAVQPLASACAAGNGEIPFTPLYSDVCNSTPFTGTPQILRYEYAQQNAPTLNVQKTGPSVVEPGGVYTYQVVVSGDNPGNISGTVNITDALPPEFTLLGVVSASAGVTATNGQTVTWNFDPGGTLGTSYVQTLTYRIRVTDTVGSGACGASQRFANNVQAAAEPACPTCGTLSDTAQVNTVVINNEGVSAGHSGAASLETCGPGGFTLSSNYRVSGATVVTWTGAVYTDALGTFGANALPGPIYMNWPGTLTVTIFTTATGNVDYTADVAAGVTPGGQLQIDLTGLQAAGAPTQNFTIYFTYTAIVTDGALAGAVSRNFNDWHRLYLPGVSDAGACTGDGTFNDFIPLSISRGDLQVSLDPPVLNRCEINTVTINVTGGDPNRLTNNVVVTFTATTAEIQSVLAYGVYTYSGGLNTTPPPTVTADPNIGGGRGVLTFTFPAATDIITDGQIQFPIDVDCKTDSTWQAGVTFRSLCTLPYTDTTVQPHTYRAPNLSLFVTPIEYTVRNKQVEWKFFVANTGNLTATNVVITNALSGIAVTAYTANPPGGVTLRGALPITAPNPVVFTITQLPPNVQYEFHLTGTIFSCTPLSATITVRDDCFGNNCDLLQGSVQFNTPDPYLLTNNGQTADLPTCDIGHVEFTTKNASPDVSLYDLSITETLRNLDIAPGVPFTMTIEDDTGATVAFTTKFTPEIQVGLTQTLLIWRVISAPTEVLTYFRELPALYVVRIRVPVRSGCTTSTEPQAFAEARAKGPCNNKLGYQENAVTLRTNKPNLSVEKQGKVMGGDFGDSVYANPGDTVVWRITVRNNPAARSYVARNVKLYDTWPAEFQFTSATSNTTYTYRLSGTNTISWFLGDLQDDGKPYIFYITGTIPLSNNVCTLAATNTTRVTFGCDYNGCTGDVVPQDTASLVTRPNLEVFIPPDPLLTCGGNLTVRITNRGAAAYSSALTVTIPAGYVYSDTVGGAPAPNRIITGTGQNPVWVWDPITIPGRSIVAPFDPYVMNLVFRLKNDVTAGQCAIPDGKRITATLSYNDAPNCTTTGAFSTTFARALNVLTPSLSLDKSPPAQVGKVGGLVSWTITLSNTGAGDAPDNLVVTDVVGTNFAGVAASRGSDGSAPVMQTAGGVTTITWQLLPTFTLQANGGNTWQATITATVLATGTNINAVEARAFCDGGCRYTNIATDTAFVTVQDLFLKQSLVSTATVGDLITFTLAAQLNDQDGTYSNMVITDALPAGLGYVSATMQYTVDAEIGGAQTQTLAAPTTAPPPLQSGNVVWNLGTVPG
ncbi:MAG: DUF11 domain-containing protein, partial [Caldilineae bacterium]